MILFSLTPKISVPLLRGRGQALIFTALSHHLFTVLNSEESSVCNGIFCQMPLMLLYPWALEI